MIRCPTCGLEWSPGTLTCPKDGTRLYERGSDRNPNATVHDDDSSIAKTMHGERQRTPLETTPPLGSEAQATTMAEAKPMLNPPPELRSGNRRALAPSLPPEPKSSGGRAVRPPAGGGLVERVRLTGPRPAAASPVQPLPVAAVPEQKNPWGDVGGTDSTFKRVHETPKMPFDAPPSDPNDPLIGLQLGEYRVIQRLGQGGMGVVYRGEQPEIGKQVAIKLLRPELASDQRQVQRLRDEARAVNAVQHPGLINIFSWGETPQGAKYFVMDLLEGQSLEELIHAKRKLKAWEALPILEGALSALEAAHSAGVIHRDLKPSNIFLVDLPDHTFLVKLLDFGLAKMGGQRGSAPQTMNVVVGTPEYMAPEQARAHEVGPRTDIYAMGIVAYEMLTGNVPFTCDSAIETLMMQCDVVPKPPGELEPSIPDVLEKLIVRMLEKRVEDRPGSAAEVKRELGRIKRQLNNAETQIGPSARLSALDTLPAGTTAVPSPPAASPRNSIRNSDTRPTPLPPGARPFDNYSSVSDDAKLEPRSGTDRVAGRGGLPSSLIPAAGGAAAVALLALIYFLFLRNPSRHEPVVVPPPPEPDKHLLVDPPPRPADPVRVETPAPPTPPSPSPEPVVRKPDAPRPIAKKPSEPKPVAKGLKKEELARRIDALAERADKKLEGGAKRVFQTKVTVLRTQLQAEGAQLDAIAKEIDASEAQLK